MIQNIYFSFIIFIQNRIKGRSDALVSVETLVFFVSGNAVSVGTP